MKALVLISVILLLPLSAHSAPDNSTLDSFKGGPRNEDQQNYYEQDVQEVVICKIPEYGISVNKLDEENSQKKTYGVYRCLWA